MVWRLPIHSRAGNGVLFLTGLLLAGASITLLIIHWITSAGYAGLIDHLVSMLLIACLAAGALFSLGARENLRSNRGSRAGSGAPATNPSIPGDAV